MPLGGLKAGGHVVECVGILPQELEVLLALHVEHELLLALPLQGMLLRHTFWRESWLEHRKQVAHLCAAPRFEAELVPRGGGGASQELLALQLNGLVRRSLLRNVERSWHPIHRRKRAPLH